MEAVIFCGIQGSGKSTFYRGRFFNTRVRLSLDMLRTRYRERIMLPGIRAGPRGSRYLWQPMGRIVPSAYTLGVGCAP